MNTNLNQLKSCSLTSEAWTRRAFSSDVFLVSIPEVPAIEAEQVREAQQKNR